MLRTEGAPLFLEWVTFESSRLNLPRTKRIVTSLFSAANEQTAAPTMAVLRRRRARYVLFARLLVTESTNPIVHCHVLARCSADEPESALLATKRRVVGGRSRELSLSVGSFRRIYRILVEIIQT